MRRADRLFQIIQFLRGGRLLTARQLSERLEVSERTVYRDIADLQSTGVPIDGAAGVGYVLRQGYDLPPLMFSRDEVVALVTGARLARAWGGVAIARAAEEALVKIEAVLPAAERRRLSRTEIRAPGFMMPPAHRRLFDSLEQACDERNILQLCYATEAGARSDRRVRPLALWFWGSKWTLLAWCEMRSDFRTFRLDRVITAESSGEHFRVEPGRTLADYYKMLEACEGVTMEAGNDPFRI